MNFLKTLMAWKRRLRVMVTTCLICCHHGDVTARVYLKRCDLTFIVRKNVKKLSNDPIVLLCSVCVFCDKRNNLRVLSSWTGFIGRKTDAERWVTSRLLGSEGVSRYRTLECWVWVTVIVAVVVIGDCGRVKNCGKIQRRCEMLRQKTIA